MGIETGLATLIGGLAMGGGAAASGAFQSSAAGHAADVQAKSAADALEFQKQQAAQDLARAQAAQKANYDQWAAKQGRLSTLGQMVGLQPFVIPPYVPIPTVPSAGTTPTGRPTGYENPNVTSMADAFRSS